VQVQVPGQGLEQVPELVLVPEPVLVPGPAQVPEPLPWHS
jgi:hypothetical protein